MKCVKCQYEMPIGYTKCPVCKHVQKNKIKQYNIYESLDMKCDNCQYELSFGYTKCPVCRHIMKYKTTENSIQIGERYVLPQNEGWGQPGLIFPLLLGLLTGMILAMM